MPNIIKVISTSHLLNKIPTKGSQIAKPPNISPNTILAVDRNMLFVDAEDSDGAIVGETVVMTAPGHCLGVI